MWTRPLAGSVIARGFDTKADLTNAEWRPVELLLPAPKRAGRPASWPLREIVNAIFSDGLPLDLTQRGKTLIAISHDERHF